MLNIKYTTGYAGTGKSTKLIKLVNKLPLDTLVVIAPTHKALNRLREHLPDGTEIKTIHALLGWIPMINESAQIVEHIDATYRLDKPLNEYINIVIDEAGMMSEDMLYDITSKIEEQIGYEENSRPVTIHCYLDPYQLLPVKGTQIQTDSDATTNLTTQYRSESPDVVALYTKFVEYQIGTNTDDLSTPYSDNVRPFDITKFKEGDRLLAYTNKAVGEWNKKIAKQLGVTSYIGQDVQLGNMVDLVKVENFVVPTLTQLIAWHESGTLQLQNSQINKKFLKQSLSALISNKDIQFIMSDIHNIYPVIVGIHKGKQALQKAKEAAIEDKKKFVAVYALGRAYVMDYSYATTVHRSQGSEFDTVFIDKKDIQKSIFNGSYANYARLMYVAISRSKKIIFI